MYNEKQAGFNFFSEFTLKKEKIILKNVLIDRKSKYSVVGFSLSDIKKVKEVIKDLKKDTYFSQATHNSYAYRIKGENGFIFEGKNDDSETGAGMCILRELQRVNGVNICLVVTRYFGGIYLQNDRFKNIINSCKIFFQKVQ